MEEREVIVDILNNKSLLKQDVYAQTRAVFDRFRKIIHSEVSEMRKSIVDDRVRLDAQDKGDFEIQVFIGSDVLVFHMHTNVFKLADENPMWKIPYLAQDMKRGFFGIINVYNFLADSYIFNRTNDPGYLIGRMMLNHEEHFLVEGKGQLGFLFRDLSTGVLSDEVISHVIRTAFVHALEFDLFAPPYDLVQEVSVFQMQTLSNSLQLKTGKRLGFKFQDDGNKIF